MSYNFLIVDDSAIIRSVVKKTLDMSGVDVGKIFEAGNGVEALRLIGKEWVDIIFTDINMPEMNGIEMVKKMAEQNLLVSTPVAIISSMRQGAQIDELKQLGVRAYLKKPFKPEEFRDTVNILLRYVGKHHGR